MASSHKLLLVDYENVQQLDFSLLEHGFRVIVFVGLTQKNVPIDVVTGAQRLGDRVEWQRVDGNGNNALDFYIACELGRVLERMPRTDCTVLSKDKGFDPLLRHLNKHGLKCRRINSLLELHPTKAPVDEPNYRRVVDVLGKAQKTARPRTRATLSKHISAMFQKGISQKDVDRIINLLFANKMISEANQRISYEF